MGCSSSRPAPPAAAAAAAPLTKPADGSSIPTAAPATIPPPVAPFDPAKEFPAGPAVPQTASATAAAAPTPSSVVAAPVILSAPFTPKSEEDKYWERPKSERFLAPLPTGNDDEGNNEEKPAVAAEAVNEPTTRADEPTTRADEPIDESVDHSALEEAVEEPSFTTTTNGPIEEDENEEEEGAAAPAAEPVDDDGYPPVRSVLHTESPCDSYELDMEAATFATCKCGHKKTAHSATAQDPKSSDLPGSASAKGPVKSPPVWAGDKPKPSVIQKRESSGKHFASPHKSDTDLL